jgi:hypothetical protein
VHNAADQSGDINGKELFIAETSEEDVHLATRKQK